MTPITIAKGDGIGPEIMDATIKILKHAIPSITFDEIQIGEQAYLSGHTSGIDDNAWNVIRKNKVFLKAPITTPQGGGYKSLNVTMRKTLGLYANVRPCASLSPFIVTKHPQMNVVIIRENEEDLYAGIEHQQTDEVVQCLKIISRPGCEKIVRYAFEYARVNGRKKVTCFSKDNIMKQTDGMFHQVFNEIAPLYPEIESNHYIVDIGAALLADKPELFDVIVMPNLYGDILSDVAAQIAGSVGLAGSANIGEHFALFEAIHGSAPDIAGKGIANPSGLIQASVLMLQHLGFGKEANLIQNAWLTTIENGIHTADIYNAQTSKERASTQSFADAVIANLGNQPIQLKPVVIQDYKTISLPAYQRKAPKHKEFKGIDLFVHWNGNSAEHLAEKLSALNQGPFELQLITNRGIKVWPKGYPETFCTDHWRCRFQLKKELSTAHSAIPELLQAALENQIDVIKTENLYAFDGKLAFSLGQGQ